MPYKDPAARIANRRGYRPRQREAERTPAYLAKRRAYAAAHRAEQKAWRDAHKEERQTAAKEYRLRVKFGLSVQEYQRMLDAQDGVCAICREPETKMLPSGNIKALAVDHAHVPGLPVRGLLCFNCNTGIGLLRERPDLLLAAVRYIEDFRPQLALVQEDLL
jgi:hypothetical protein